MRGNLKPRIFEVPQKRSKDDFPDDSLSIIRLFGYH